MSNNNPEKQFKIYIRSTKTWVPVTEEVYREYYRPIWRIQKAARKAGQCIARNLNSGYAMVIASPVDTIQPGTPSHLMRPWKTRMAKDSHVWIPLLPLTDALPISSWIGCCWNSSWTSWRSRIPKADEFVNLSWIIARKPKLRMPSSSNSAATGISPKPFIVKNRSSTSFENA